MKLSISNIAWTLEQDEAVYDMMRQHGFTGLEIAPTRVFPDDPYDKTTLAVNWSSGQKERFGFTISSMQSIWYGRKESIFGSDAERESLESYTKKAILFAESIGCQNLVFGCPRNRVMPEDGDRNSAISFFRKIGNYAFKHHTVIALEANPPIYHTNFINTTQEAIEIIREIDSPGFLLNLDVGTMIENQENISVLNECEDIISHVHISEPGLKAIIQRDIHRNLIGFLASNHYQNYISIETAKQNSIEAVENMIKYVRGLIS